MKYARTANIHSRFNKRQSYDQRLTYGQWHVVSGDEKETRCGREITENFETLETTREVPKVCIPCRK